ncbi:MAG TPA: tRNA (uridine(34)/cytosine(34)/5-carboxymethylaminomethyluridine(34)-2'-O)-methyltransferase TrmL [Stenotrophobium sp.]|nr:tRNA (uridine(34)/cytosine(34)/5-carboxymethylaminomethyluridine(34)-2'-O)-methyltransferase TrmL [Stenotrophobium sp.]
MIHVALYQPEIPPNTGNIIRLCANTGAALHLIRPLGFRMDDRDLRRAGLDYHEYAEVQQHDSLEQLLAELPDSRLLAFTTKAQTRHDHVRYRDRDILLFGPESRGLPPEILERLPPGQRLRIPMRPGSRSINLSNAAAVAVYEAWRQGDFAQGT